MTDNKNYRWVVILPTQMFTMQEQQLLLRQQDERKTTVQRKHKCRGNRKLEHLKRKCRRHDSTEDQITG